jgi:hypothetical protein
MKTLKLRILYASLLMVAVLSLGLQSALARPSISSTQPASKIYDWKRLEKNNIMCGITNCGQLCQDLGGSNPCSWWPAPTIDADGNPVAPCMNYVYGWGLWVGAKVKTTRSIPGVTLDTLVTQGYNPSNSGYEYTPGGVVNGVPASAVSATAKIYSSLDAGWAEKNGNDTVYSVEDSWCQYNDYNASNHISGRPLKIEITQTTYQWNYPTNTDIVFFLFEVRNTSSDTLKDVYLAPTTDCDIGNESGTSANDVCYWDSTTNMGYQYNATNTEIGWTRPPGCVGFMFLESPIANKDFTAPDGYHLSVGDTIGLFAFKVFNINIDPPTDIEQYQEMAGYNYQTGEFLRLDPKPASADQRFMESTGPINMAPGEKAKTIVALICANFDYSYMGANDTLAIKELRQKAITAKFIYDNHWLLPGPPKAPGMEVLPGHHKAMVSWDKSSWDLPDSILQNYDAGLKYYNLVVIKDTLDPVKFDPNYRKYSFEGIKLYKSENGSDWSLLGQWDWDNRYQITPEGLLVAGPETLFTGMTSYVPFDAAFVPAGSSTLFDCAQNTTNTALMTNATNSGLIYSYEDGGLTNGNTYYYSVTAYGINFNKALDSTGTAIVNKTPLYFETSISSNIKSVIPRTDPGDYVQANGYVTYNQGLAYGKSLIIDPALDFPDMVKTTSYKQVFGPVTRGKRFGDGNTYVPQLSYRVMDSRDSVIVPWTDVEVTANVTDSTWLGSFAYTPADNYVTVKNYTTNIYGFNSFGVYKIDPVYHGPDVSYCKVSTSPDWRWAYRSSVLKIVWHVSGTGDTLVSNDTLTCEVWDETNNVPIAPDTMRLDSITTSGWSFGSVTNLRGRTIITATSTYPRRWMNICGMVYYFNNPTRTTLGSYMTWANHPNEGEVWRIYPNGITVPTEGECQTVAFTAASWVNTVDWTKVKVVPNPYLVRNLWETSNERSKLQFINLPAKCTIKIFTIAGNLIKVIEHENDDIRTQGGTAWWDPMLTMNNQNVTSGVYIYHVNAPGIGTHIGKFAVIK